MATTAIQYANKAWEIMRDLHLCDYLKREKFEFNVTIGAIIKGEECVETTQVLVNYESDLLFLLEWENGKVTVTQFWGENEPVASETYNA